jgi:hypothetical protein
VHARRRALARGVQARHLASPVQIGEDAADRVVRRGCDRDRRQRRVVALVDEAPHQRRKEAAVDGAEIEVHRAARGDLARDDVTRRELVGEAVAPLVEQESAFAAQRFGEQQRRVDERRRVELDELEVGERRAGRVRRRDALAHCPCGVRRPLPERGRTTGREERRSGRDRATIGDHADTPLVAAPDRDHPLALGDADPGMCENALGEPPGDAVARGGAARMDDPAAAVPTFQTQPFVERDAELDEVADTRGRLVGQDRDRTRSADATTGAERVLGVQRRIVVLADRGGDSALREQAGRGQQRPLREYQDVALGGRAKRREEPGDAAPDHDEGKLSVSSSISRFAHGSFRL